MPATVRFYRDGRFNGFEPLDDSFSALGSLLTDDVMNSTTGAFSFLDKLEGVRLGARTSETWEGNGWAGDIRPEGLRLQDLHSDDWTGDYSLAVAREVTIDYVRFLLPDPEQRARALAEWEAAEARPHPARADI